MSHLFIFVFVHQKVPIGCVLFFRKYLIEEDLWLDERHKIHMTTDYIYSSYFLWIVVNYVKKQYRYY
jgi:hypothetical protein